MPVKIFTNLTDEEIVTSTLKDPDVFLHIMQRYEGKLLTYIKRLTYCETEEAEDILQETFIKTYQNLNNFSAPLKFSSWIYRIAHNESVSYLRKKHRRPQIIKSASSDEFQLIEHLANDTDIHQEIQDLLRDEKLRGLIERLDKKYRDVLILRYFEEKDYQEISDILRLSIGTVSTMIHRAKKQLREVLEKEKI